MSIFQIKLYHRVVSYRSRWSTVLCFACDAISTSGSLRRRSIQLHRSTAVRVIREESESLEDLEPGQSADSDPSTDPAPTTVRSGNSSSALCYEHSLLVSQTSPRYL